MTRLQKSVAAIAAAGAAGISAANAQFLEPATQAFVDSLAGSTPIYELTPEGARQVLHDAQSGPVDMPAVSIEDRILPVGPKGETAIRIIRPQGATGALPVLVYFHGAGWVMGDTTTHDRLVRELAVGANAAVVFVDYSRSPENRYPVAIEEDYAVTSYIAQHGGDFGLDPSRLVIGGDSVGGNMVAVVSLLASERNGPEIDGQLLFYPVTDAGMNSASYTEFADGPWLTKPAMEWFWNAYLPDVDARQDIHVSPINATTAQLSGLPEALVITGENDVLRDEGEAYADKLAAAGVRVTATRYNGTIHDFVMLNALADTPAARGATRQAIGFLRDIYAR